MLGSFILLVITTALYLAVGVRITYQERTKASYIACAAGCLVLVSLVCVVYWALTTYAGTAPPLYHIGTPAIRWWS